MSAAIKIAQVERSGAGRYRPWSKHEPGRVRANDGHPTTAVHIEYSEPEWEFMRAIQEWKNRTGRQFPTWREVHRIFVSLGYHR